MTQSTPQAATVPGSFKGRTARPPGPKGLPFLGNTLELLSDMLGFLTRISRDYGDVVRFTLPGREVFLLNHPDAIEEALKEGGDNLSKDDFTQRLSYTLQ